MIGATLGQKYKIVRLLGEGGMGAVYEAEQQGSPDLVAIKVIRRDRLDPESDAAHRFRREVRAAGAIESEHIVAALDAGDDEATGVMYLVMERLSGQDLQQRLQAGPLPVNGALRVAAQALMGLVKAHEAHIVHRDIKPANIFLAERPDGSITVKILDFGIAKIVADPASLPHTTSLTTTGGFLGSPRYMSPEQVHSSRDVDHRTDLWSLGCVLYCALTGQSPHARVASLPELIFTICAVNPPPLRSVAPWVPPEVADVVHGALALDPDDRYPSAAAMLDAIEALLPQGTALRQEMLAPISKRPSIPPTPAATSISALVASRLAGSPGVTRPSRESEATEGSATRDDHAPGPTVDLGDASSRTTADLSAAGVLTKIEKRVRSSPALSRPLSGRGGLRARRARWRAIATLALVAAIAAIGAVGAFRWKRRLPRIEPFAERARGMVFGGPWLVGQEGRAFCQELSAFNGGQAVRCIDVPLKESHAGALQAEAREAGALLSAVIDGKGRATLTPLGLLEHDELLGRAIAIDLGKRAAWPRVFAVLDALARMASPWQDIAPEHLACPPLPEGDVDRTGLLALLLVPSCASQPIDPQRLLGICKIKSDGEDCALARYLYTEHCPNCPDTPRMLADLRKGGPLAIQSMATLKVARAACQAGSLAEATETAIALSTGGGPCRQAAVAEIAACILASGSAPVDPRLGPLEGRAIADEARCPEATRAQILGRRAYYRGRGQRWAEAASDYAEAYRLSHTPIYALSHAEALLQQRKPSAAYERLAALSRTPIEGADRFYAALLRWIAARDGGAPSAREEADTLEQDYKALALGKAALDDGQDRDLRTLACPGPAVADCALDVLSHPKTDRSTERLHASLHVATTPALEQGADK